MSAVFGGLMLAGYARDDRQGSFFLYFYARAKVCYNKISIR